MVTGAGRSSNPIRPRACADRSCLVITSFVARLRPPVAGHRPGGEQLGGTSAGAGVGGSLVAVAAAGSRAARKHCARYRPGARAVPTRH